MGLNPEQFLAWLMEQTREEPAPYPSLSKPCKIWQRGSCPGGYAVTSAESLWNLGTVKVHRAVVALTENVPVKSLDFVCHLCDRKRCIEPTHLVNGTAKLNAQHRDERGRSNRVVGSKTYNAKLTELEVLAIRSSTLLRGTDLSKIHGVCPALISDIRRGHTWKHVTSEWCLNHLTNLDDETILDLIAAPEETEAV